MLKGYLYDATGKDKEVDVAARLPRLSAEKLLWLDGVSPSHEERLGLEKKLGLPAAITAHLARATNRSFIRTSNSLIWLSFFTPVLDETVLDAPQFVHINIVIGKNWLLSSHDGPTQFLDAFRAQDLGETRIGVLTADVLAAALLGWHLEAFMDVVDRFEQHTDELDAKSLASGLDENAFITAILKARRSLLRIKHKLNDQRLIFQGLSRPDIALLTARQGQEHFQRLERHYLQTADAMNRARDWTADSFSLHESMQNQATNKLVRRLTFFSIVLGTAGAVAGIFGMNFQTRFASAGETGFWLVVVALLAASATGFLIAWRNKWL
jgi:magnesium transporter